jgi:integrase
MEQKLSNRRRYLTAGELEKLIKAGRKGRHSRRDATLMLVMARHGLRVTEAVALGSNRLCQGPFAREAT